MSDLICPACGRYRWCDDECPIRIKNASKGRVPNYTRTWTNIGGFNGWTRTKLEMRRLERDDRRAAAGIWAPERHHIMNVLQAEKEGFTCFDDQRSKSVTLMCLRAYSITGREEC